jgi:hypothetical protein
MVNAPFPLCGRTRQAKRALDFLNRSALGLACVAGGGLPLCSRTAVLFKPFLCLGFDCFPLVFLAQLPRDRYNNPLAPNCTYGFTDTIAKTGHILFSSLLFVDASREMAALSSMLGCGDAAAYAAQVCWLTKTPGTDDGGARVPDDERPCVCMRSARGGRAAAATT